MLILLFLLLLQANAKPLYFQISGIETQPSLEVRALGKQTMVQLLPNGPKQWLGVIDQEHAQLLHLHLTSEKTSQTLYRNIVVNHSNNDTIYLGSYAQGRFAQSYAAQGEQKTVIQREKRWLKIRIAWFVVAVFLVGILSHRRTASTARTHNFPWWVTPFFFCLLSLLWIGPSLWTSGLPGRHFDTLGTYWFLARSPTWEGLFDPSSGWPNGGHYGRPDSFVLLALAWLFQWLPSLILFKFILFFAPTLSAWSASYVAEKFGAKRPWSWLAGIAYAYNGLAAATILEGHIYHLLQPWMPLLLWFWWRATDHQGTRKDALLAAICWALCMLTSAYVGLGAAILMSVLWLGRHGWKRPASFWGILLAAGILLVYITSYAAAPSISGGRDYYSTMVGSINIGNFWGHRPELDHNSHSQNLGVLAIPLTLAVVAGNVLRRRSGWPILWLIAAISLSLAFGAFVTIGGLNPLFPMPLFVLGQLPIIDSIGFPIRLAWPFLLCSGILSALVLQHLASRHRFAWILLLLGIIEPLGSTMLAWRLPSFPLTLPTAYQQTKGPVLDVYPVLRSGTHSDVTMWLSSFSCFYQSQHGQPIADNCVSTDTSGFTRLQISQNFMNQLLQGNHQQAISDLKAQGFVAVTLFPDLYTSGDQRRILAAMAELALPSVSSTNGGIYTQVYQLPTNTKPEQATTTQAPPQRQWGSKALGTTEILELEFITSQPISSSLYQIDVNGERFRFPAERSSPLLYARIQKSLVAETSIKVIADQTLWQGTFYPAAEHEIMSIDENQGWRFHTPVSSESPVSSETGKNATWLALLWLGCLFGLKRKIDRKLL